MRSDIELLANHLLTAPSRHRCNRVLDTELPLFIELLAVAAENQVSIKDALRTVSYNSEDVCPFISSEFRRIIANVAITQKSLAEVLPAFAEKYDSSRLTELTRQLIEVEAGAALALNDLACNQRLANIDFEQQRRERLRWNSLRRALPLIVFFLICALPITLTSLLGPRIGTAFVEGNRLSVGDFNGPYVGNQGR